MKLHLVYTSHPKIKCNKNVSDQTPHWIKAAPELPKGSVYSYMHLKPPGSLCSSFPSGGTQVLSACWQGARRVSFVSRAGLIYTAASGTTHCQRSHIIILCLWKLKSPSCVCILISQLKSFMIAFRGHLHMSETLYLHGRFRDSLPHFQGKLPHHLLRRSVLSQQPVPRIPDFKETLCHATQSGPRFLLSVQTTFFPCDEVMILLPSIMKSLKFQHTFPYFTKICR